MFLIIVIISIIILSIYIYYKKINMLLSLLNCSYISSNLYDTDKIQCFISTHDYEHIDLFILINEFIKNKTKITIVTDNNIWNHILYYYLR